MNVLDENAALEAIQSQLRTSNSATLAVAFWGTGAAKLLGLDTRDKPTKIICNLAMGGSNPAEIENLIKRIGEKNVLQNSNLHAKIYMFDEVAFVGSSNASTNGLSVEGSGSTGWYEANVAVREKDELSILKALIASKMKGSPITQGHLEKAKIAWRMRLLAARQIENTTSSKKAPLIAVLNKPESDPALHDIHIAVYQEPLSGSGRKASKEVKYSYGPGFDIFEGWKGIVREKPLASFFLRKNGKARFDGLWTVKTIENDQKGNQLAEKIRDAYGYKLGPKDLSDWLPVLAVLQRSTDWKRQKAVCWSMAKVKGSLGGQADSISPVAA